MSQNFTDDSYDADHVAHTDMTNQENNDLALKSCFYGASSPANPTNGMFWADSSTGILKIYYNGWVSFFDFINARVYNLYRQVIAGTGLSGGGYLTADRTINHSPHSGDVTGADELTIATGAVEPAMLQTEVAGANNYFTSGALGGSAITLNYSSYTTGLRVRFHNPGEYRFYWGYQMESDNRVAYFRVLKNGVVFLGPFAYQGTSHSDPIIWRSDDLTLVAGDELEFQGYAGTVGYPGRIWVYLRGTHKCGIFNYTSALI